MNLFQGVKSRLNPSILRNFRARNVTNQSSVAPKHEEDIHILKGRIETVRTMKKYIFADLIELKSSRKTQLVIPKSLASGHNLAYGCSVIARGQPGVAPNGAEELKCSDIRLLGECSMNEENGFPFTPKQSYPPDYAREHLYLRNRLDYMAAIMRIRRNARDEFQKFMKSEGFGYEDTPTLTTNDCEGAGETFTVLPSNGSLCKEMNRPGVQLEHSFFNNQVFLSVSSQFELEAAAQSLGDSYTLSKAHRAENNKSPLHLSEFFMLEAEQTFLENIHQLTAFVQRMIKVTTENLLESSGDDFKVCQRKFGERNFSWLNIEKWTTLSYDESFDILDRHKDNLTTHLKPNEGFSKEQEAFLVDFCKSPVFVVNWPKESKPFYMRECPEDGDKVAAFDLLMPDVGELVGGSLRESNFDKLKDKVPSGLSWYLELRRFGYIPTGGFGMGFERYLLLVTGVKNIRDVIPYPRYAHSCK